MRLKKQWLLQVVLCAMPVCISAQQEKKLPLLKEVIKADCRSFKGMFNLYVQEERYLAEVPDRLLGRDILTSIIIIRGSAQRKRDPAMRFGFAGDAVNDRVIRFRKASGNRLELITPVFSLTSDSSNIYYQNWKAALQPAYLSFPLKAVTDSSSLIDVTEMLGSDNDLVSLKGAKEELKLGSYEPEKSKILGVRCFENNIVFRTIKSYGEAPPAPAAPGSPAPPSPAASNPTIWEVGASWYLLPEQPMQPRLADKRVGYFATAQPSYDKNPQQVEMVAIADRWRIEPRPEDRQSYLAGSVVAPAKPILFYIDRNMPAYLVPYVIKGVNAWQSSFEKIGFKNAITARLAPEATEDSAYSMEDVRYSFISYKPSEMANAYGPHVVDPRSGEILSSHIAVFHNVLDLLQRWYFSMCAATDSAARQVPFSQALMGKMLQTVITHEVGHTLGLRHDFAGSASYETDSIRIPEYVRAHGFGPSIMDYMRFNYVAQPQDGMTQDDLMPGIGVYDNFAIDWGYRYRTGFATTYDEALSLSKWVSAKRKDPRFFYLDESDLSDPRVQSEDIGSNSMKANSLAIENLKHTMQHLEQWVGDKDKDFSQLRSLYRALEGRYYTYLGHVLKNIGGSFNDQALRSENSPNYTPVSRKQQKEAVNFLYQRFFIEQAWMYPVAVTAKTRFSFEREVEEPYENLMGKVVSRYYFVRRNERYSSDSTYTALEYINDLFQAVCGRFPAGRPLSRYERFMQRTFVNKVLLHAGKQSVPIDINAAMIRNLETVAVKARQAAARNTDLQTVAHYRAMADLIDVWRAGNRDPYLK